ncbi:hypothetical protein [Rhizobium mongolense]
MYDVEGDFVSEDAAFADLRDGYTFPALTYIHFGESAGLATSRVESCFIDGFFTQIARLGDRDGNMLTFTCGFEGNVDHMDELGPPAKGK